MTTTDVEHTPVEDRPAEERTVEIDPRIHERRLEVKRAVSRRRLRAAIVGASIVVVFGLALLTLYSPFLDVDHVRVSGTKQLSPRAVQVAAGVQRHDAMWFFESGAATRRIEMLPWVRSATVTRDFPDTVRIAVREYTAVAYVRAEDDVVLIAGDGRAIARVATPPAGTKEIVGVRRAPTVRELLSPPTAADVVRRVPPALAAQVAAVDVSGNGLALVLTNDGTAKGGAIRLGNGEDLDAKMAATLAVLRKLGGAPFAYIDVSTPSMPTVMESPPSR